MFAILLKKSWITERNAKGQPSFPHRHEPGRYVAETWSGWFLFGFIPILVKTIEVKYS